MTYSSKEKFIKTISNQEPSQYSPSVSPRILSPHFRYADYNNRRKAQQIQVKFWKLHSCDLSRFYPDLKFSVGDQGELIGRFEKTEDFENTLKHSTIKRSLKFTKKIKFSSEMASRNRSFNKLCKTLKLETLSILVPTLQEISMTLAKAIMKPGLEYCSLLYESFSAFLDPKLISSFRRLRKSNIFLRFFQNNFKLLLNTDKLLPWKALSQINQIHFPSISNDAILVAPKSIKSISYRCDNEFGRSFDHKLPKLPNLQLLELHWNTFDPNQNTMNLSFLKQYLNLRSLTMKLLNREAETLDFLSDLPCLRNLFLCFEQSPGLQKPLRRTFPNLTKLEKFGLWLDEPILFSFDNIKSFIYNNRDLKRLDLSLKIQNIGSILEEENGNISLPNIENLRLDFIKCERPFTDSANKIVKALGSMGSLKNLRMEFNENFAELNKILLKESLASIKSLETLILQYFKLGTTKVGLNNFQDFQNIFENLKCLKSVELDFNNGFLQSAEIRSILDGLCRLQKLEKFRFTGDAYDCSDATLRRFYSFLVSIRHLKNLHFSLNGICRVSEMNLWKDLLPKFPLSTNSFKSL